MSRKNNMRSPEEKEKIVLEYLNSVTGYSSILRKYEISEEVFRKWVKKYREKGIDGLVSQTGRKKDFGKGRPKTPQTEEEKLKLIIMKQEIDIERLKKGYLVKGVGAQKEYVTTPEKNMKS